MKVALLSDIHGNAVALEAVIKDIKERQVDKIFVLGDICFRGPQPKESLSLVCSLRAEVIKGNADAWVLRGIKQGEVPPQAYDIMSKECKWTYSRLAGFDIEYLEELPIGLTTEIGGTKICLYHATPHDLFEVVQPDAPDEVFIEKMFINDADIYFYGHIHKAFIRYINGKTIVNLGSVGMPFDGVAKASYALLDISANGFQTSIVKVDYDVEKVIQQINDSDYPNKEFLCKVLKEAKV